MNAIRPGCYIHLTPEVLYQIGDVFKAFAAEGCPVNEYGEHAADDFECAGWRDGHGWFYFDSDEVEAFYFDTEITLEDMFGIGETVESLINKAKQFVVGLKRKEKELGIVINYDFLNELLDKKLKLKDQAIRDMVEFFEQYDGDYEMGSSVICLLCVYTGEEHFKQAIEVATERTGIERFILKGLFCGSANYSIDVYGVRPDNVTKEMVIEKIKKVFPEVFYE